MANGFRTIPSAIAQQAALAQLREIQNPNLALQRQLEQAAQLQQLQQQSPEGQLALQLKQAQLAQIPLQAERQQYELDQLRAQLDPNYQAQQNAAKIAFEVDKARQLGQVAREFTTSTPKTFTLSPGQKVFDQSGKEIASLPSTDKDSKPIIVSPGSRVINSQGEEIFNNPLSDTSATQPVYDPQDPTKLLGYTVPKNFQSLKDLQPTSKPAKPLPISISNRISDATTAIDNLITLKSYIDSPDVKKISGPVYGRTFGQNPLSGVAGNFAGIRGTSKQNIGKYLENGVLREADERKYEKIVPSLTMLPSVQTNQATELYRTLKKKLSTDISTYEKAGYNVDNLKDAISQLDSEFANVKPRSSAGKVTSPVATPGINRNAPSPVSSGNTFEILP